MKKWILLLPKTIIIYIIVTIILIVIGSFFVALLDLKRGSLIETSLFCGVLFLSAYIPITVSPDLVDSRKKLAAPLATLCVVCAMLIMSQMPKPSYAHYIEPTGFRFFLTRAADILGIIFGNYNAYKSAKLK